MISINNQSYAEKVYKNVFPKQIAWIITLLVWSIILGSVLFSDKDEYKNGALFAAGTFIVLLVCSLLYTLIVSEMDDENTYKYKIDILGWVFHITLISLTIKEFINQEYNMAFVASILVMLLFILYKITSGIISDNWVKEKNERGFLATMLPDVFVDTKLWLTYMFWKRKFGRNNLEYKLNVFDFYNGNKGKKISKNGIHNLEKIYKAVSMKLVCIKATSCIYISKNGDLKFIHAFKKPVDWKTSKDIDMKKETENLLLELVNNSSLNYDSYKTKVMQLNRMNNLYNKINSNEFESLPKEKIVRVRAKI